MDILTTIDTKYLIGEQYRIKTLFPNIPKTVAGQMKMAIDMLLAHGYIVRRDTYICELKRNIGNGVITPYYIKDGWSIITTDYKKETYD